MEMRQRIIVVTLFVIYCCLHLHTPAHAGDEIVAAQRAADSINAFAFDLYNEIAKNEQGNIFFSPQNISSALAMLHAGADGETERELRTTLHYGDTIHEDMRALQEILNTTSQDVALVEAACAVWPAKNLTLLEPYVKTIRKYYDSDITQLDYANNPRGAEGRINGWANEKTRGKIPQIVSNLPNITQLVLTSAIYFNSEWQVPFPKIATRKETFYHPRLSAKRLDLMLNRNHFRYAETEVFQALQMQYKQEVYSMLVLLPKGRENTVLFDTPLSFGTFDDILRSLTSSSEVVVCFPKFKLETDYEMGNILAAMGIKRSFADSAQFAKLADTKLKVDRVIHKTFIELNEERTEAAAATTISMVPTSSGTIPKIFIADHPFVYFILENRTNAILFMGRFTGQDR